METPTQTARIVHRIYTGGTACFITVVVGLIVLIWVNWIIGTILLIIGIGISNNSRLLSTCGECGNEIANTSRRCPHCQSHFTRVHEAHKNNGILYAVIGSLSVIGIIALAMWWLVQRANQ